MFITVMEIAVLILLYLWVTLLHATFSGVLFYALWGHRVSGKRWLAVLLLAAFLGLLETYWIPIAAHLGLTVHTHNAFLLEHFDLNRDTDLAPTLHPHWYSPLIWLVQGTVADYIGNSVYRRMLRKAP